MANPIRVLIVDENDLVRQATRALLESAEGMTAVGEAKDRQEAIELIRELQPDVVLWGVDTLRPDDLQTMALISELCPYSKIIVLSVNGQERLALEAFRKGARGYLVKGKSKPPEIVEAIRTVSRGGAILSPGMAGWILDEISQKRQHEAKNGKKNQ
jgi:DNA-binding NarL/FixJ family response regulator